MNEPANRIEQLRGCDLIKASIAHLTPRKQQEVERAVRMLRVHFVARRRRAPKQGFLHRLVLVGSQALRASTPDRETGEINHYEIWAFVNHAVFRGLNSHWGLAQRVVALSLRGRATVELSVFTTDEVERLRANSDHTLTHKYNGGVVLYERDTMPAVIRA